MDCNKQIIVCADDELGELASRGYEAESHDEKRRFFVVRKDGRCHAYRNICPHAGAPLNWSANKFLSYDRRYIQCSLHGALFEITTGRCIAGPCKGASLTAVPARVEDNKIIIDCE